MPSTFQYTIDRHYSPVLHGSVSLRLWLSVTHFKRVAPSYTPSECPFRTELHGWTEINWCITNMFRLTKGVGNTTISSELALGNWEELTEDEKEDVVSYLIEQMKEQ